MKVEGRKGEVTTAIPLAERLGSGADQAQNKGAATLHLWLASGHVAVQVQNDRDRNNGTN